MVSTKADIRLQNVAVGRIRADSARIRSEGGPHNPWLVLPVDIELDPRPKAQQLALVELTASMHLGSPTFSSSQIGSAYRLDLHTGMPLRTVPGGPTSHRVDLRFGITQRQIEYLEDARRSTRRETFALSLSLEGSIVWLRRTYDDDEMRAAGWPGNIGLASESLPFWYTGIEGLGLEVEQSSWVRNVLPGLGHDRVRLIEVDLTQMPEQGITAERFDEAIREFDEGRYADCIATCRDIRYGWEQALEATKQRPIAKVVAEQLSWPDADWHYLLLDKLWAAFADISNVPHHSVKTPQPLPITAVDAKLCLQLTLTLSEYIDRARKNVTGGL
jgi:hypothetical protein